MTRYLLVIALALASFTGLLGQFALSPLLPVVADDIGSTVPLLGQTVTVSFLAGAVLVLAIGPMADHVGHRKLMLVGATLVVLSSLGTSQAIDYWTVMISRIPGGLGGGIMASTAVVLASTRFSPQERRWAIGWTVSGMSVAPVIGVPSIAFIGEHVGWRASFVALGLLGLLSGVLLRWAVSADVVSAGERFRLRDTFTAYRPLISDQLARRLQISNLLRAIGWGAAITYFSAYLIDGQGLSLQQVSYFYLIAGGGYLIGTRLGDGRLSSLSLRSVFSVSTLIMGLLFALIYTTTLDVSILIAPVVVAVAAGGIGFVSLTILMSEGSPAGPAATMMMRQSGLSFGVAGGGATGGLAIAVGGFQLLGIGVLLFALASALTVYRLSNAELPVQAEPPPEADSVPVTPVLPSVKTER